MYVCLLWNLQGSLRVDIFPIHVLIFSFKHPRLSTPSQLKTALGVEYFSASLLGTKITFDGDAFERTSIDSGSHVPLCLTMNKNWVQHEYKAHPFYKPAGLNWVGCPWMAPDLYKTPVFSLYHLPSKILQWGWGWENTFKGSTRVLFRPASFWQHPVQCQYTVNLGLKIHWANLRKHWSPTKIYLGISVVPPPKQFDAITSWSGYLSIQVFVCKIWHKPHSFQYIFSKAMVSVFTWEKLFLTCTAISLYCNLWRTIPTHFSPPPGNKNSPLLSLIYSYSNIYTIFNYPECLILPNMVYQDKKQNRIQHVINFALLQDPILYHPIQRQPWQLGHIWVLDKCIPKIVYLCNDEGK